MSSTPSPPIRVLLADESELIRVGVKTVLAAAKTPVIEVVGEAGTIADAVRQCIANIPDVVMFDMRLPDGSGADLCRKIFAHAPNVRAIVLTSHEGDRFVYEGITAGVHGYLLKNVPAAELVEGVREVAAGRSILDIDATKRILRLLRRNDTKPNALSLLSKQERRVLELVAEGLTNKQVGQRLDLSRNTVKNYLISVFEKLKVSRRAEATALYVRAVDPKTSDNSE